MHDMPAAVGSSRFMRHGVNDAKERIGECHACQALCVMHAVSGIHVSVKGSFQITVNHFDCMKRQRIGIIAMKRGNVSLDRMSHSVHPGMSG